MNPGFSGLSPRPFVWGVLGTIWDHALCEMVNGPRICERHVRPPFG